jgi:sRNA-binding protein
MWYSRAHSRAAQQRAAAQREQQRAAAAAAAAAQREQQRAAESSREQSTERACTYLCIHDVLVLSIITCGLSPLLAAIEMKPPTGRTQII